MKKIKLSRGMYTLVDDSDFEVLNRHKWHASKHSDDIFYASRCIKKSNGKGTIIRMHSFLMNPLSGMVTDHIDHNGLNNQRSNLRICTYSQNQMNRRCNKNNKVGLKGVCKFQNSNKWRANIKVEGKIKYLGSFTDKFEAFIAYKNACIKYHKEFALYKL